MNLRRIFASISIQLSQDFERTAQIDHNTGKGDAREDAFISFLTDYIPKRYTIGRGQIISHKGISSKQCDIVIYDGSQCPRLLVTKNHSIYPLESVFGVIEVKSVLSAERLREAYDNIRSVKELAPKGNFTQHSGPGIAVGFAKPLPVGVIVAYRSGRSLDAIAKQIQSLNSELPDSRLRPDWVAVIGEGIIGPQQSQRGHHNETKTLTPAELTLIRRTGRHSLLRLYLQLLQELNSITLDHLDLKKYLRMPEEIDGHMIQGHDLFVRQKDNDNSNDKNASVRKLSASAIAKILKYCANIPPITMEQHFLATLGQIPRGGIDLTTLVYHYNPRNLPPLDISKIKMENGRFSPVVDMFHPVNIGIDGKNYFIDIGALTEDDWERHPDFDLDEFFAEYSSG